MDILYALIVLLVGLAFGWIIKLLISKNESGRLEERNKLLENSNSVNEAQLSAKCEKVIKPNNKFINTYDYTIIEMNTRILL